MGKIKNSIRLLWIAPNFNHYKKRFLTRLAESEQIDLELITGRGAQKDEANGIDQPYRITEIKVTKSFFAYHPKVYVEVLKYAFGRNHKSILMPLEKKLLPLVFWIKFLQVFGNFSLVTYNHPVVRSRRDRITRGDIVWTRWLYKLYDRVILYTEQGRDWCVEKNIIAEHKAFWANNTLDTESIWQINLFEINTSSPLRLLFIGSMNTRKRVDLLLEYFWAFKREMPSIKLTVIGDGPDAWRVQEALEEDIGIKWCGTITDEMLIAKEMQNAHAVFIPGESGLSVVHAFAYGKPYFTLEIAGLSHGPEIAYLRDGENGLLLAGHMNENIAKMKAVLENPKVYSTMCTSALSTSKGLSMEMWCKQMVKNLTVSDSKP